MLNRRTLATRERTRQMQVKASCFECALTVKSSPLATQCLRVQRNSRHGRCQSERAWRARWKLKGERT